MNTRAMAILCLSFLLFFACVPASAGSLTFSGVLGNSGEQGAGLVKFGLTPAHGLGVVYDKYGTLWDRAGDGVLNRYALDGRLIATYPIRKQGSAADAIALADDQVILLLSKKLYTLSVDAPPGAEPNALSIDADEISHDVVGGKLALLRDGSLILLDLATKNETPVSPTALTAVHGVEVRPDGSVVVQTNDKIHLFQDGREVTDGWPRSSPGTPFQFLDNFWFGYTWHGTVRRFNAELEADPGVVLGGGSGSFIGHVDENAEVESCNGMASLGDGSFAVSGVNGVMHLIHWNPDRLQMEIIRRIGAIPICHGLGLNRQGDVWFNVGKWKWTDGPAAPLQEGTTQVELGQVSMLPNDSFVAASTRAGMMIESDNFTYNAKWPPQNFKDQTPALLQASVVYQDATRHQVFLAMDKQGKARAYHISSQGQFESLIGPVTLTAAQPVAEWTSLAMKDKDTMLAGADGQVMELVRDGDNWRESKRWNAWGSGADARFGPRIFLSTDGDHLWVSDTTRHRVHCFSLSTQNLLASYGKLDEAGNDLSHLDSPEVIIGRESRAVLFDSGNQRLVKLSLKE